MCVRERRMGETACARRVLLARARARERERERESTYAVQLAARGQASSSAQSAVPQEGAKLKRILGRSVHLCDFLLEDFALFVAQLVHGVMPASSARRNGIQSTYVRAGRQPAVRDRLGGPWDSATGTGTCRTRPWPLRFRQPAPSGPLRKCTAGCPAALRTTTACGTPCRPLAPPAFPPRRFLPPRAMHPQTPRRSTLPAPRPA
jgi:hypothetical protein